MIRRIRSLLAASAVAVLVVTGFVSSSPPAAHADSWAPISGTGSTWSQNALDQWRRNVGENYGMTVNYSGVGSSAGRRDFINGTVDFAISEIPFQSNPEDGSQPEVPRSGYAYMPIVAGGTAFMYNLKIGGKRVTNLRLSGAVVTKIFSGAITKWNDPAIQADNPGLAMPDRSIVPVVRSDGSGSSAQFTLWMSKQHGDIWTRGMTSQFPTPGNGKAQNGSLGVAGYVSQDYGEGAITYVEYSYAVKSGFPVAKVLNSAGYYIEPTAPSVAVALLQAQINNDPNSADYLTQILDGVYNNGDPRTYPLSSYSYLIVPTQTAGIFTAEKGRTLGGFAEYVLCEGQQSATALGYSPLPMNLVLAGSEQLKRIPGANANGVDINRCNNPTFKPGDSPSNNQLAVSAPAPAECDKQGPNQCTSGTAGSAGTDTPVTGTGSGGSSAEAGGAGGAAAGAATADAGTAAAGPADAAAGLGDAVYDANGNLVSGSAASGGGGVAAAAVSSPFTLAEDGWKAPQWLMLAAALLLIAAIVLPPVGFRRMRSNTAGKR
ncbi:phosphate ABC transporter substrate-binding protein PstS [Microbacterium enclense]|uniref:phosphate ABC transporter substrate-binding protein PstS n=1 Tax=Microbacterium enclense TaxID=993073 RepID=UPI0021A354FA|nr:phosphate ABC transporter substrate-binding protein PstS [Microbacterium enclense]MCT2084930.1 phosphate ABC transporter substrate-binding protein PstS [Microbacterium enclense]